MSATRLAVLLLGIIAFIPFAQLRCWANDTTTLKDAIVAARQEVQRLEPSLNWNDVDIEASNENSDWTPDHHKWLLARDPALGSLLRGKDYWAISIVRKPVVGIATNDTGWTIFVDRNTGTVLGHARHGD